MNNNQTPAYYTQLGISTILGTKNFTHKPIPKIHISIPKGIDHFVDSIRTDNISCTQWSDHITIVDGEFILNGMIWDSGKTIIMFQVSYKRPDFREVV